MHMSPLDRARLEKALNDHGFDLTPTMEGDWLVGRSTQHPIEARLFQHKDGAIALSADDPTLAAAMARDEGLKMLKSPAGPGWQIHCPDFESFHRILGRFAALARSLPNRVAERFAKATVDLPKSTEAERLVIQRVGQNLFRNALVDYWQGRCAMTGLELTPLLRASHIKPWAACENDEERLDVFNGLLLAPQLDALFDGGWITFLDDGTMVPCSELNLDHMRLLGVHPDMRLDGLTDRHRLYMAYHRSTVFRGVGPQ